MRGYIPIYAVDFDGTLCESVWPGIGEPNIKLIDHLIKKQSEGARLILWTCRVGERLQAAVDWCRGFGLVFDAVNENIPEMIERYGTDTRKIVASCYIDDLAVDREKYGLPFHGDEVRGYIERYWIGSEWDFCTDEGPVPVMIKSIKRGHGREIRMRVKSVSENKRWKHYECEREVKWFADKLSMKKNIN